MDLELRRRLLRDVSMSVVTGCWEWCGYREKAGYGRVMWQRKSERAHRLSWMAFCGPLPKGAHVLHKCDNPPCINPDHLSLGTHADNMHDMAKKGRRKGVGGVPGEKHYSAKLTVDMVLKIRAATGSMSEIGKKFGVCPKQVWAIRARKVWKHV